MKLPPEKPGRFRPCRSALQKDCPMSKFAFWDLAALGFLLSLPAQAQVIFSPAIAIDGDSLTLTGTRIRLFGIDAPEGKQTCERGGASWACGQDAAHQLRAFVADQTIRCEGRDTDADGLMVAVCFAGNLDLARSMVEAGLAIALPNGADDYGEAETRARKIKYGLWGATFDRPSEWRAAHRDEETQATPARSLTAPAAPRPQQRAFRNQFGCTIKGNRNREGQWIYHLPGMPYYDITRPEELFCTEAAAQAAGYRRAVVRQ